MEVLILGFLTECCINGQTHFENQFVSLPHSIDCELTDTTFWDHFM